MRQTLALLPRLSAILTICVWGQLALTQNLRAARPNVVFVMTDDQGYGDLSCTGNPVLKTPNIDALSRVSVRLNDYHVSPTCSPTRSALLTGHWTNRTGVWHTIMGRSLLRENETTVARIFSDDGYATGMFGKWHLGDNYPYRPEDRGFQEVMRHGGGGVGQTPDYWDNAYFDGAYFHNSKPTAVKGFCSDVFFDYAKRFIKRQKAAGKPFFAYIATNAPHGPMHSPLESSKPYLSQNTNLANFYGMIANIDDNVGRMRSFLKSEGLEDNTIFVFTTDNGTSSGAKVFNAGMRGRKGSEYDGGHRVPFFIHWPAGGLGGGVDVAPITAHVDVVPTLMDLCGVKTPQGAKFDGRSIRPLLEGKKTDWPDRILVTDSQRVKDPIKWRKSAVMTSRWRLVNGSELYDITSDPGQEHDVAGENSEVVERLTDFYDAWWEELLPTFKQDCAIYLGHAQQNPTTLTCHDWITTGSTPWNQSHIRNAQGGDRNTGFWHVLFWAGGEYEIRLRRWPAESGAKLGDSLPAGASVPGATAYRARPGKSFKPVRAVLRIGDQEYRSEADAGSSEVVFRVKRPAGTTRLSARFYDEDDRWIGAYYAYVKRDAAKADDIKPKAKRETTTANNSTGPPQLQFPLTADWGVIHARDDRLELRVNKTPDSRRLAIPRLNNPIGKINIEGVAELKLKPGLTSWEVLLPKKSIPTPFTVTIATVGKPLLPTGNEVAEPTQSDQILLPAHAAVTHGRLLRYEPQPHKNTVGYWADANDWCHWSFRAKTAGTYRVSIEQGCGKGQGGSSVEVKLKDQAVPFVVEDTGHFQNFKWREIGLLKIANAGVHSLQIKVIKKAANAVMDVRSLKLTLTAEPEKSGKRPGKRPNIVFCFADDWGRYASAYRKPNDNTPNAVVNTPNFDRIAQEGVLFNNAFVNAPSCTPCRSSLLSGQYFFRTGRGAILQGAIWDAAIPSYPLLLRDAGYHIGHTYKVWSPGSPANAPYGAKQYAYNQAGNRFNRFSQQVSQADDIEQGKSKLLAEVRGNFTRFLDDRKEAQPFCYWFGPTNCHRTWIKGSGKDLWGLEPDDLKGRMPSFLPDNHTVRQDMCDYLGEVQAFDAGVGVIVDELKKRGELEDTLLVVSGDHGIPGFPGGKCNLYDFGVHVALAIRWGKNIPQGRAVDDFVNLPDLAPTFLDAAGLKPPSEMTARSLLPVLRSSKKGLVDPSRDYVVVGRERHVARARINNLPYPQRAIRTKDFLYIRNFKPDRWPMGVGPGYGLPDGELPATNLVESNTFSCFGDMDASPTKAWIVENRNQAGIARFFDYAFGRRPAEELFDLASDPQQTKNLADSKDYRDVKQKLSSRLMEVLTKTGDPRVTGKGSLFDESPYSDAPPPRRRKK
jgi:arylsulfatase A-like enzyme